MPCKSLNFDNCAIPNFESVQSSIEKLRIQLYLFEKIGDKSQKEDITVSSILLQLRNLNLCSINRTFPPKNVTSSREKIEDRSPDKKKRKEKNVTV